MDAITNDLAQVRAKSSTLLVKSTPSNSDAASSFPRALDSLIQALEQAREQCTPSTTFSDLAPPLQAALAQAQSTSAARTKEYYNALVRLGRDLDKKFLTPLDGIADRQLFSSVASRQALDHAVVQHLMRAGEWQAAEVLMNESNYPAPATSSTPPFRILNGVLASLAANDLGPAIAWATSESAWLTARGSQLEFALHRSAFLRIALGLTDGGAHSATASHSHGHADEAWSDAREEVDSYHSHDGAAPAAERALLYARQHLTPFLGTHLAEVQKLFTLLLFIPPTAGAAPTARIPAPYRGFLDETTMHAPALVPAFEAEWCARMHVAREAPLKLVVEVGAGGALIRIEKAKAKMKKSGNEWSQANELPTEIPLPPHLRFHSTFACPVSKEQGSEANPPMMMACGHVVCRESLACMGKGSGRVKCPYCPTESTAQQAIRVHF